MRGGRASSLPDGRRERTTGEKRFCSGGIWRMAIFHLNAHVVSRGKGQNAVAKAAYNSRTKLEDERTGQTKDYRKFDGLMFSGVFVPKDAPAWASDRQQLWNAVERREDESNRAAS